MLVALTELKLAILELTDVKSTDIVPIEFIRIVVPSARTVPRYEDVAGIFSAPFMLFLIFCFDMNPNDIYSSDPNMLKDTDEVVDCTDITSDCDNESPIVKNNESDG